MRRVEVTYTQRPGAPYEAQSIALARIYARALQRYQENRKAPELASEPNDSNAAAIVDAQGGDE